MTEKTCKFYFGYISTDLKFEFEGHNCFNLRVNVNAMLAKQQLYNWFAIGFKIWNVVLFFLGHPVYQVSQKKESKLNAYNFGNTLPMLIKSVSINREHL